MFTFEYSDTSIYKPLSDDFHLKKNDHFEKKSIKSKFHENGIIAIDLDYSYDQNLIEKFDELCSCFGSGYVRDAMRRTKLKTDSSWNNSKVAAVDPDYVHRPHSEASFSPAKPAIICFICTDIEEAAMANGLTTIMDGRKIWKNLDIQTKKSLLNADIIYDLAIDIPSSSKNSVSKRREWYLDSLGVENAEIDQGLGKMFLRFRTPFVTEHPLSRELALANHAFIDPKTENQIVRREISFDKNLPISEKEIRFNLFKVLGENIRTINWRKGRCLFLDNYRFMHGRLPYNGKLERKLLIKQLKKFSIT